MSASELGRPVGVSCFHPALPPILASPRPRGTLSCLTLGEMGDRYELVHCPVHDRGVNGACGLRLHGVMPRLVDPGMATPARLAN